MEIAGHELGLETEEAAQIVDRFLEGSAGFQGLEITDVLAEENVLADADSNRVLEMAADGQYWRHGARDTNAEGRIAASAPQNSGAAAGEADHGIVTGPHDGTVVHQEMVSNVFQAERGFVVADRDGFVAAVATGCNQWETALLHEQMMQRRIRQHHPEIRGAVGDIRSDVGAGLG